MTTRRVPTSLGRYCFKVNAVAYVYVGLRMTVSENDLTDWLQIIG